MSKGNKKGSLLNIKASSIEGEKRLVASCLSGSKRAWDGFVKKYAKLIYNSIYRTLELKGYELEPDLAEDLWQEVFLSLLKNDYAKLKSFKWKNNCSIATWIGVITRNLVLDYIRKESKQRGITESLDKTVEFEEEITILDTKGDEKYSSYEVLNKKEILEMLAKSMNELPASDKILLELLYYDGLPYEEIAKKLGKSVNAIYMQKKRVTNKLQEIIRKAC